MTTQLGRVLAFALMAACGGSQPAPTPRTIEVTDAVVEYLWPIRFDAAGKLTPESFESLDSVVWGVRDNINIHRIEIRGQLQRANAVVAYLAEKQIDAALLVAKDDPEPVTDPAASHIRVIVFARTQTP
jgi:hypothetical protein